MSIFVSKGGGLPWESNKQMRINKWGIKKKRQEGKALGEEDRNG